MINKGIKLGGLFYKANLAQATNVDWVASHYTMVGFVPSVGIASSINYLKSISHDIQTYIILDPSVNINSPTARGLYVGSWDTANTNAIISADINGVPTHMRPYGVPTGYYMDMSSPSYAAAWANKAVNTILASSRADGIILNEPVWNNSYYINYAGQPTYYTPSVSSSLSSGTYSKASLDGIFNTSYFVQTVQQYMSSACPTKLLGIKSNSLVNPVASGLDSGWKWIKFPSMVGYTDNFIKNTFNTDNVNINKDVVGNYVSNICGYFSNNTELINNLSLYLTTGNNNSTFQTGFYVGSTLSLSDSINFYASYSLALSYDIGTISSNYYSLVPSSSVIKRSYTGGIALFNTSGVSTQGINLNGVYKDTFRDTAVSTIMLAPYSGAILNNMLISNLYIDDSNRFIIDRFGAKLSNNINFAIYNHQHHGYITSIDLTTDVTGTISLNNIEGVLGQNITGKININQINGLYHNGRIGEHCEIVKDPMYTVDSYTTYKCIGNINAVVFYPGVYVNGLLISRNLYTISDSNTIVFTSQMSPVDVVEIARSADKYKAELGGWKSDTVTVYKNYVAVPQTNYTFAKDTGIITFNSNNTLNDYISIDIPYSNIANVGTHTHSEIDDKVSEYSSFLDYKLGVTHEFNIGQRGIYTNDYFSATYTNNKLNYKVLNTADWKYDKTNPGNGLLPGDEITVYNPSYPILPTYVASGVVEVKVASYTLAQSFVCYGDNLDKVRLWLGKYEQNRDTAYTYTVSLYNQSASSTPYQVLKSITNDSTTIDQFNKPQMYEFDFRKYTVNRKEKYYIALSQTGGSDLNTITWYFRDPSSYKWGSGYFKYNNTWYLANNTSRSYLFDTTSYSVGTLGEEYHMCGNENYGNIATHVYLDWNPYAILGDRIQINKVIPSYIGITVWIPTTGSPFINSAYAHLYDWDASKNAGNAGGSDYINSLARFAVDSNKPCTFVANVATTIKPGYYYLTFFTDYGDMPLGIMYGSGGYLSASDLSTNTPIPSYSLMYEIHGFEDQANNQLIPDGVPGENATYIPSCVQIQSFTSPDNNLSNIQLYLTKIGSPRCSLNLSLENADQNDNYTGSYINIDNYAIRGNNVSADGGFVSFPVNAPNLTKYNKYLIGLNVNNLDLYNKDNYISWNYWNFKDGTPGDTYPLGISEYKTDAYYKEPDKDRGFILEYTQNSNDDSRKVSDSIVTNNDLFGKTIKDIDICLLLDNSGSMLTSDEHGLRFDAMQDFIISMNNSFGNGVNFDLISFMNGSYDFPIGIDKYKYSTSNNIVAFLGNYNNISNNIQTLIDKINVIKNLYNNNDQSGSTPIYDSLIYSLDRLNAYKSEDANRYKAIVLFTDGASNSNTATYDYLIEYFKKFNTYLYIVYLNTTTSTAGFVDMQKMAKDVSGKSFYINNTNVIQDMLNYIKDNAVWSKNYFESTQDFYDNVIVDYVLLKCIIPTNTTAYYTIEYKKEQDKSWTSFLDGQHLAPNVKISTKFEARYVKYTIHLKSGSSPIVGGITAGVIRPNKEYNYSNLMTSKKRINELLVSYANTQNSSLYNHNFGICLGDSKTWVDYTPIEHFNRVNLHARTHERTTTLDNTLFTTTYSRWYPGSTVTLYTYDGVTYTEYTKTNYTLNRLTGTITFKSKVYKDIYVTILPPKSYRIGVEILTYDAIKTPTTEFSIMFDSK